MKATTIIIAAVLSLQVSFLFAGNSKTASAANNASGSCTICILEPVTPGEATFEETTISNVFVFDVTNLAPVTPVEAEFSEVLTEMNADMTILAPVTPSEADFNDTVDDQSFDLSVLAPATPYETDFE